MPTAEGIFRVIDRASGPIKDIASNGTKMVASMQQAGKALDDLDSTKVTSSIKNTQSNVSSLGRQTEQTSRKVSRNASEMARDFERMATRGSASIEEMTLMLRRFEKERATATLDVDIAAAEAKIRVLKHELRTVSTAQARSELADLGVGVSNLTETLTGSTGGAGGGGGGLARGGLAGGFFAAGGRALFMAAAFMTLLPAIVAVSGAVVALVGSLGAAVGGAGAVGIGVIGAATVGFAAIAASALPAAKAIKEAKKAQDDYNKAVRQYGRDSAQAASAHQAMTSQFQKNPGVGGVLRNAQVVGRRFRQATRPAQRQAFGIVNESLEAANDLMPTFGRVTVRVMKASREAVRDFFAVWRTAEMRGILGGLGDTFARSIGPFGRALGQFSLWFGRVARAASPLVIKLFESIEKAMASMADRASNARGVQNTILGLVEHTKEWWRFTKAVTRLFMSFFGSGAKQGKSLLASVTDQLNKWSTWIEKNPDKMAAFFDEAVSATKSLASALAEVATALYEIGRALIPVLQGLADTVDFVGDLGGGSGGLVPLAIGGGAALAAKKGMFSGLGGLLGRGGAAAAAGSGAAGGAAGGVMSNPMVGAAVATTAYGAWANNSTAFGDSRAVGTGAPRADGGGGGFGIRVGQGIARRFGLASEPVGKVRGPGKLPTFPGLGDKPGEALSKFDDLMKAFDTRWRAAGSRAARRGLVSDIRSEMRMLGPTGRTEMRKMTASMTAQMETGSRAQRRVARRLKEYLKSEYRQMGRNVEIVNGRILQGTRTEWRGIARSMSSNAERAAQEVTRHFTALQREAVGSLVAMGFTRSQAKSLVRGSERSGSSSTLNTAADLMTGTPGEQQAATNIADQAGQSKGRNAKARGGRIPGIGTADSVPFGNAKVAPGEMLIANRHTERKVDERLGYPGALDAIVRGEKTPHGMRVHKAKRGHTSPAGFARGGRPGGIVPIPWDPGEYASAAIIPLLRSVVNRFKADITDAYGQGHQSPGHTKYGTAVDLVPGAGGSWQDIGRLARWAVGRGYKVLYDGSNGTTAWPNHGPGNHIHIEFGGGSTAPAGGAGGGVGGAIGAMAEQLKLPRRRSRLKGVPGALSTRAAAIMAAGLEKKVNQRTGAVGGGGIQVSAGRDGVLTFNQVARLAESVGLPGITFAQIARGESGFNPRAVGNDPGGTTGLGLWQITTKFNDDIIQRFGGRNAMFNPRINALAAKAIYDRQGIRAWYGTKYMTGTNLHYEGKALGGRVMAPDGQAPRWGGWHAKGTDFVANRPTLIGVGDGGRKERVTVTPDNGNGAGVRNDVRISIGKIVNHEPGDIEKILDRELSRFAASLSGGDDSELMD